MKVWLDLKSVNPLLKPKPFPVLIIFLKVYFLDMDHERKKDLFILQKMWVSGLGTGLLRGNNPDPFHRRPHVYQLQSGATLPKQVSV